MTYNKLQILLVEDDQIDVMSIERAVKKNNVGILVVNAVNGLEALEKLRQDAWEYPLLILLDINMPIMNGIEFLKQLRADCTLKKLPVVVLTTSDEPRDITRAYEFNVAGYVVKPLEGKALEKVIKQIIGYWSICELPERLEVIS